MGVDEVRMGDEGGGEADGGAVEGCDEDFGVRVEGLGDVEVVGEEGAEPVLAGVFGGGGGWVRGGGGGEGGDVRAAKGGGDVSGVGVEGVGERGRTRKNSGLCR